MNRPGLRSSHSICEWRGSMNNTLYRHRMAPVIGISAVFLAVMLTFLWSVGRYWSGVLQPRLAQAAQTHAEVLANAQATPLADILERTKGAVQRRALDTKLQELLLIVDPAVKEPLFKDVDLTFDYDLLERPSGSLDISTGERDCKTCYKVEVPLIDDRSNVFGIATFWVTDAYYRHLASNMKHRLYTEMSVALVVFIGVWVIVLVLYFRLQRAKELVEVSDRAKTRFLANVSHELRTPLNAILGYTQLFKRNQELMRGYGQGISTIDRSAEHLLLMINDILDFSRVESDKVQLIEREVSLEEFLGTLVEMTLIRARLKDIGFHHEFQENLPQVVNCDDKRLRQVLLNLLNNAVKFTRKGGVTFRVFRLTQQAELGSSRVRFEIADTGPGIPGNKLGEIFLPFHQLESSEASAEGSGLGLAISSNLLGLMGAKLRVESRVGEGSRFWFDLTLPVVIEASEQELPAKGNVIGYDGPELHILSVDDNALNRDVIHQRLAGFGFRVSDADGGARALEVLASDTVDLVLLDLLMPEQDGYEVLAAIRQRYSDAELPVIAMTASAQPEAVERGHASGFRDILFKPIAEEALLTALAETLPVIWRYEGEQAAADLASSGPVTTSLVLPEREIMQSLKDCARQHDVLGLRKQLEAIKPEPGMTVFVDKVQSMVRAYQFGPLVEWLESFERD
ncbi:ATP-binding protein [Marinobacter halodurans]|uniref:ATP-binding protein n=1 Tax=Marinobacter halodurans TaxID=2528979 RepID=UPI0013F16D8E|nr:ATP-binding protein [Marinobacter halodurans]